MKVTRRVTATVTKCPQCPYFEYHPQEPNCALIEELVKSGEIKGDCYTSMVGHHTIDPRCPLKKGFRHDT